MPDGDYMAYLRAHGLQPQPGHFRTLDGRDLGPHKGMEAYTLGQRRGLEIAAGERIYVVRKAGADVILGPQEALFSRTVFVGEINLIALAALRQPMRLAAKLRYTPKTAPCTVYPEEGGLRLEFDEPQRAPTPGQAAVLYDGPVVIGGGTIMGVGRV